MMEPSIQQIAKQRARRDEQYEVTNRIMANRIRAAREAGATWVDLAAAMGITRQGLAAFLKRYR